MTDPGQAEPRDISCFGKKTRRFAQTKPYKIHYPDQSEKCFWSKKRNKDMDILGVTRLEEEIRDVRTVEAEKIRKSLYFKIHRSADYVIGLSL